MRRPSPAARSPARMTSGSLLIDSAHGRMSENRLPTDAAARGLLAFVVSCRRFYRGAEGGLSGKFCKSGCRYPNRHKAASRESIKED